MADFRHLTVALKGSIALVTLNRPDKRNAVNRALIEELAAFFNAPPKEAKVIVINGAGDHFCAGLDLAEQKERTPEESFELSQFWHRATEVMQFGGRPLVAAMHGAVIGGGLELAVCAHVRIAEPSAFYALPEGRRGIFVGGGASVRVGRIIGYGRTVEMMLTGRRYEAEDGLRLGLSHYLVGEGEALAKAMELTDAIAGNAPLANRLIIQALPRIGEMSPAEGLLTEELASALTQATDDARAGMEAFLKKTAIRFDR
jgi:enoyl-CoA hydratase/carnithine racemase